MPGFSRSLAELAELSGGVLDARATHVLLRTFSELHEELADQVTKVEFRELTAVVQGLAEAQQRTEQRLEELAEAQKGLAEAQQRTERRIEELAEAQKNTEAEVRSLATALKETRTMVGGLSDTVGYTLEDRAIRSLPRLLPELAGVTAEGAFERRWVADRRGELVELNIYGYGRRASGEAVTVVGEAKARARVKDVDNVRRLLARLQGTAVVRGQLLGVLVSYQLRPEVEERAAELGVLVVPSYRLQP